MLTASCPIDGCAARQVAIVRRAVTSAATLYRPANRRYAIARLPRRAVKGLREQGPKATISYALAAAGIRRVIVYTMQRENVLKGGTPIRGVTPQVLAEADLPAYLRLRPHATEEEVTARIRKGDRCIVAWRDGCLVAARWLATAIADIGDLEVSFPLRPGVAYAYDAFTAPQERRRGIGAMLGAALFDSACAGGATHVINAVLPENRGGQGLARGRSKRLGMLRSNRLGPWLIVRSQVPPGYLGAPLPIGSPAPSAQSPRDPI